jgi:hypothetical protein
LAEGAFRRADHHGHGPYTHTFVSGAASLPSIALEVGMPEMPIFFTEAGVRVNSAQLSFARSGAANATLNCIAQGETDNTTTGGGTPTVATLTRFNQFQGRSKRTACSSATSRVRS